MSQMYFIDKQHEQNYKAILMKWPKARRDTEYQSSCYILAEPNIYQKVGDRIGEFVSPIDWIWQWEWSIMKTLEKNADLVMAKTKNISLST